MAAPPPDDESLAGEGWARDVNLRVFEPNLGAPGLPRARRDGLPLDNRGAAEG